MHSDNLARVARVFQLAVRLPRFGWLMTALSIPARMAGVPSTWPLLQAHAAKAFSQSDIIKYSSEERESKLPCAKGI